MSSSPKEEPRYDPSIYDTPFASLPNPKRVWLGKPGSKEESLGRLTLLTPDIVSAAASSEIKTGIRVGLGWDMTKLEHSQFGRQKCQHAIIPLGEKGSELYGKCFDDAYSMNPQQSSQWDGFRHYSQPRNPKGSTTDPDRVFYGGVTKHDIVDVTNKRIGIHGWCDEGIAGRGILLDYKTYADAMGIVYKNFSTHAITFRCILDMLEFFHVQPKRGDLLFIRMGVMPEWEAWTLEEKEAYSKLKVPEHAGVEATLQLLQWIWNSGISAVAGDAISWEVYPTPGSCSVHEYLLAGWGLPIGELFDLEDLAKTCKQLGRYSFFVTSMPLNMPGGVSSPPNAMAIF